MHLGLSGHVHQDLVMGGRPGVVHIDSCPHPYARNGLFWVEGYFPELFSVCAALPCALGYLGSGCGLRCSK